jgi:hypothetical protein
LAPLRENILFARPSALIDTPDHFAYTLARKSGSATFEGNLFETLFESWRNTMKKRIPKGGKVPRSPASPSAKPPSQKVKQIRERRFVRVDYPTEGETITSQTYSFRISASQTDRVEVSIDHREWSPCRPSVGYWWYDWSDFGAGPHSLLARILSEGKRNLKSKPREFTVRF